MEFCNLNLRYIKPGLSELSYPGYRNEIESKWQSIENLLSSCLEVSASTVLHAIDSLKECMKLEIVIYSEFSSNKKEMCFNDQKQLIDLCKSLQRKHLTLALAIDLFGNHKRDLTNIIEEKSAKFVKNKFLFLEKQFLNLVLSFQIDIKVKISKLGIQLQLWKDLEETFQTLKLILKEKSTNVVKKMTLTEFNELELEVNNYFNQLKVHLRRLTPVFTEHKYIETSNLIVFYEFQFSQLQKDFNEQQEFLLLYFSKPNESDEQTTTQEIVQQYSEICLKVDEHKSDELPNDFKGLFK